MFLDGIACSQLVLLGEYAAAYGYPAIGIPLPETTRVTLLDGIRDEIRVSGLPAPIAGKIRALNQEKIIRQTPYSRLCGKEIHADSSIPEGMGCGFTAAFCTALARAVIDSTDRKTAWEMAHELERYFHGASSGIETGLALGGGIKAFHVRPGQLPAVSEFTVSSFFLVYGAIPGKSDAGDFFAYIGKERVKGNVEVLQRIRELGEIAENAVRLFGGETDGGESFSSLFPVLVNRAQEHLSGLGAGSRELDTIIKIGREAGAPAGKISGTGSGGAFFFFVENEDMAAAVQAAVAYHIAHLPVKGFARSLYFGTGNSTPVQINYN